MVEAASKDYIIEVYIGDRRNGINREIRVPGSIFLDKLAELVIIPAMGWCFYYHDNFFMDTRDGSLYGDCNICRGPDHVFRFFHGYYWVDNSKVRLCDVLQAPKDSLIWVYDLGARMEHVVEVTRIEDRVAGRKR